MREETRQRRLSAIAQCAVDGLTRQEAAEKLGLSIYTVGNYGRRHSIPFRHASEGAGVDASRAETMAAMYRAGKTLAQIGALYGLTRERVRQIINKQFGMTAEDGGQHQKAIARRKAARARKEAECFARNGCTLKQLASLRRISKKMQTAGDSYNRTPFGAFQNQRSNARARGIEWNLTLWGWWTIWQESGHWEERGRARDAYVMCRFGDEGAYEVGNVYIATLGHNSSVQPNNPYRLGHPRHEEVMQARAA